VALLSGEASFVSRIGPASCFAVVVFVEVMIDVIELDVVDAVDVFVLVVIDVADDVAIGVLIDAASFFSTCAVG